jgi:hypothetical protein
MRNRENSSVGGFPTFLTLLIAILAAEASAQVPNQYQGPPNGDWNDASNWSAGHVPGSPGNHDDVVTIPAGSGTLKLPGTLTVNGLNVTGAGTVLSGGPPGDPNVKVVFGAGGVNVGAGAKIEAADGGPGQPGGNVDVLGTGDVVNDGEINAGDGGGSAPGAGTRSGGNVRIRCWKLVNNGWINAGRGGNGGGGGDGCGPDRGRNGGHVDITTSPSRTSTLGRIKAGDGGTGGVANGQGGSISHNGKAINPIPGQHLEGSRISLFLTDPLNLGGAPANSFVATNGTIRIDAPSVILTGIAAGTLVFDASEVCLPASLVLDPGVSIQSLCGSAIVHLGSNCAAASSFPAMEQEFEDAPLDWVTTTLQGPNGFSYVTMPGAADARFGCRSAVANAAQNGGAPMSCRLETTPLDPRVAGPATVLVEWTQRAQLPPGANGQFSVVTNGIPTPVHAFQGPLPPYDFFQLDLTPFLPPVGTPFSLRWQFQGQGPAFWGIDEFALRIPAPLLGGQAPAPGVALFDINDARNANDVPVFFAPPGPFFTTIEVNTTVNVTIQGPSFGTCYIGQSFLLPNNAFLPGLGQLDIDPLGLLLPATFPLPLGGNLGLPVFIPPTMSGLTLGFQAMVIAPAGPAVLTNAVEVRFGE